jgi:hypothetical protein
MGLTQMANVLAHDSASRAAEDVADEKNVQEWLLSSSLLHRGDRLLDGALCAA